MCELFIIRHAIAHERDASAWPNDDERPLTDKGIQKFRAAARGLARLIEVPDELLTSSLVRARQTATILIEKAEFPQPIELEELKPSADVTALIGALRERTAARIALVGHEPTLSVLLSALLGVSEGRAALELKKGAVVQLGFPERVEAGAATLYALLPPSVLRAVGQKR